MANKLQENFLVLLSDLFNKSAFKFDEHTIFALQIMAISVIFRFQCNPILFFFLCKLTPNTGNCYFCIFLIFLTEFSSVLFFEKPIHFFPFGKQSGKSVRVTLYTLLQLSLGTRVPNTKRTLFTSCSHTRHVPVCNSKAICWGSLSPVPSPFQNCLLF